MAYRTRQRLRDLERDQREVQRRADRRTQHLNRLAANIRTEIQNLATEKRKEALDAGRQ